MKFIIAFLCSTFLFAFTANNNKTTSVDVKTTSKLVAPPPLDCVNPANNMEKVLCLVDAFKATLTATQVATLQLPYTLVDAQKWSNLPNALGNVRRVGLQFGNLSAAQITAAKNLLKAATSTTANEGFAELDAVLAADDYLGANGGGATTYGAANYFIAFLGTPSVTGKWELQFGGHHYTFANTYYNGVLAGATPSFRSSEPSGVFTQGGVTYQPMLQELAAFAAVLTSLSATEQVSAKLSASFGDILLGPGKDNQFPTTKVGIKISDLSADKKTLILTAIKTYVEDLEATTAARIMAKYTTELDNTYLAFSGTTAMTTKNDYIRIDGPNVWIEYSMQGGIVIRAENHPHSVWRDRSGDYGGAYVGVKEVQAAAKAQFTLAANYPNPFAHSTTIPFTLSNNSKVKLTVFDLLGREIVVADYQDMSAGKQEIVLNNTSKSVRLSQGTYMYQLTVENSNGVFRQSKMLIVQ
jgi:Protein of unknown function (DUF3500)/Secretion system C-terminal sorting domain